jgi:hypothetical protein
MSEDLLIPRRLTIYGVITSLNICVTSIIAFHKCHFFLSLNTYLLCITSILHWNKIKKHSIIRTLDECLACLHVLYLIYNYFQNTYWFMYIFIGIFIHINNCAFFEYTLYFINNTPYRELCFKINIFIHLFCLHILHFSIMNYYLFCNYLR